MFGSHITGVELGPDYCVLVRPGRRGSRTTVAAARSLTASECTASPESLAGLLRLERRAGRLPHRVRVVAWDAPTSGDPARMKELEPFIDAGFEIDRVLSPIDALATLVARRQSGADGNAVAALALNSNGAALAIVSGGKILCSRMFAWPLGRPFTGRRSELLDRYLIISELAPELQHLIDLARPVYGVNVTSAVACGNLPNLRSLMMLLIDEMDIEVETLDAADFVEAHPGSRPLADSAAALHLACAASVTDLPVEPRRTDDGPRATGSGSTHRPAHRSLPTPRINSRFSQAVAVAAIVLCAAWTAREVAGWSPVVPILAGPYLEAVNVEPLPVADVPAPTAINQPAIDPVAPELRPEPTMGRINARPRRAPASVSPPSGVPQQPASPEPESVQPSAVAETASPLAAVEDVPLPDVEGVMIAGERRLAIVGGMVVAPGDRIGNRTVVSIDKDGVVLREPSGKTTRLSIRARKPPTDGS